MIVYCDCCGELWEECDCTDGPTNDPVMLVYRAFDCDCQHTDDGLELRPEFVTKLKAMEAE